MFFLFTFSFQLFSQPYGNEWIKSNQKYFKIPIGKPGIYRLDYTSLIPSATDMKLDLSTVKPKKWQMFYKGKEIPIYVSGIYTLKVQSNDANGTKAGSTEYMINFTVINKASATNFYPYPNPFTTSMRFVYTLTGNQVPDYINVKIMTIQGKVVKELNKDDLGDVHIGNNISEVVWDGTDEYGDRLSNGVYLYVVSIKLNGEEITQLENDNVSNDLNADKANNNLFKHSTGKIVLLR